MRRIVWAVVTLAVVLCLESPGGALESRTARYDGIGDDDWSSEETCLISYYNFCTGWVWVLGFDDYDAESEQIQLGVHVAGSPNSSLVQSRIRYWSGSPAGRGYTGTIAVYAADANECPTGPALASQAFLPPEVIGNAFYTQIWNGMVPLPGSFVLAVTIPGDIYGDPNPLGFGTDRGTTGPTGPDACGTCFPTGRQSHSFLWRDSGGTYCPGLTLVAQVCEVELLWDLSLACPTALESASWGTIKALYR